MEDCWEDCEVTQVKEGKQKTKMEILTWNMGLAGFASGLGELQEILEVEKTPLVCLQELRLRRSQFRRARKEVAQLLPQYIIFFTEAKKIQQGWLHW